MKIKCKFAEEQYVEPVATSHFFGSKQPKTVRRKLPINLRLVRKTEVLSVDHS